MSYIRRINTEIERDIMQNFNYALFLEHQLIEFIYKKCKIQIYLPNEYPFKPFICKICFNYKDSFMRMHYINKLIYTLNIIILIYCKISKKN